MQLSILINNNNKTINASVTDMDQALEVTYTKSGYQQLYNYAKSEKINLPSVP